MGRLFFVTGWMGTDGWNSCYLRSFNRKTNFSPDQTSSTAHTFTSTKPFLSPISRATFALPPDHEKTAEDASAQQMLRGLQVEPLTPAVRQQLHLGQESHGVVISQVDPDGAAAAAGIREGDVIEEVNHQSVASVSEFEQAMRNASGQATLLRVVRDGTGFYVAIGSR